jgi:hypothetical protein
MSEAQRRIYGRIVELCAPWRIAPPWEFVAVHADFRRCVSRPEELLHLLLRDFGQDALLEVGAAQRGPAGELRLSRRLEADQPLLVLRDSQGAPYEIVTPQGCLSGQVPLFQIWRERWTQEAAGVRPVFGVNSLEDAAILRSLGLAAAPIAGLEHLCLAGIRVLASLVDAIETPRVMTPRTTLLPPEYFVTDGMGDACLKQCRLLLMPQPLGEDPNQFSPTFTRAVHALGEAQEHLDLEWLNIAVLWPTEDERRELQYLVRHRAREEIVSFLLAKRALYSVEDFADPNAPPRRRGPSQDLITARRTLMEALAQDDLGELRQEQIRRAKDDCRRMVDRQLVQPLLDQGLASRDPIVRNKMAALAEVARILHFQAIDALEELQDGTARERSQGEKESSLKAREELLATVDRLVALGRQVR